MIWKGFLTKMFALVTLALQSSCGGGGERPDVELKLWAGSASKAAIERRQDKLIIECSDPYFNRYVCMDYDDLNKLEEDILERCDKWK